MFEDFHLYLISSLTLVKILFSNFFLFFKMTCSGLLLGFEVRKTRIS